MRLRTTAVTAALLLAAPFCVRAQEVSTSAMYIEAGGNGLHYSVNYEGRLASIVSARFGFMATNQTVIEGSSEAHVGVLIMPVMATVLMGSGTHRLELGAGPLIGFAGTGVTAVRRGGAEIAVQDMDIAGITSAIGYRYHPPRGGLLLRVTATPFVSGSRAQIWGGVSVGWAM
jgi:hypothetical protein